MAQIVLTNVSVHFASSNSERKIFPPIFGKPGKLKINPRFSLRDINLSLKSGDRVGLVGKNGAGKTTLLRVISGIIKPTNGEVSVTGEVGSLFGPTPFINYSLSARVNIQNFCALNNYGSSKTSNIIEDIESFVDIGAYFDSSLQVYSAGMQARFNFALLTAFEKDILVMDEAIGAGDMFFRDKVESRLSRFYSNAEIMVLASHSSDWIKQICNKCLVIRDGEIVFQGDVEESLQRYSEGDFS